MGGTGFLELGRPWRAAAGHEGESQGLTHYRVGNPTNVRFQM